MTDDSKAAPPQLLTANSNNDRYAGMDQVSRAYEKYFDEMDWTDIPSEQRLRDAGMTTFANIILYLGRQEKRRELTAAQAQYGHALLQAYGLEGSA